MPPRNPRSFPLSDHARKVLDAIGNRDTSAILSSWRRCLKLHKLDPDDRSISRRRSHDEIEVARQRETVLIEAAGPYLDRLFGCVRDSGCSVLLTDATGIVLTKRSAGPHDFWDRAIEPWTGGDLGEHVEGTNAGGTCLIEKRPITIHDGEHFYARNTGMVSSGTPIFGADGGVAGAVDVVRPEARESPTLGALILAAVIDTARRIELTLFARAYPTARIALATKDVYHPGAVLAIDDDGLVVGVSRGARHLLGLNAARCAMPFPATALDDPEQAVSTLAQAERRAIDRAMAMHGGNVSAAARALGIGRNTLHRKLSER